jgi:hypothetical protein
MVERVKFNKYWNSYPYLVALPVEHPAREICWRAWWRQVNADMTIREWNRELVKASEYESS